MKKIRFIFLYAVLLFSISMGAFSQQDQRIHASYIIAFGRDAIPEELNYWLGRGNFSISQLMQFHKAAFTDYPNLHRASITRSYMDALGRKSSENEMKYWINTSDNYAQLLNKHMQFLQSNSRENEKVVRLAYTTVYNRLPSGAEINFWKKKHTTPFFLLVAHLEDYKKKNENEAGKSNNFNLEYLSSITTVMLSPALVAEVFTFMKNNGKSVAPNFIKQNGKNIIVAGKGDVTIELVN